MVLGEEEALMKISGIRSSARQRDLRQELIRSSSDAATDDEKGDVSPEHGSSLARSWGGGRGTYNRRFCRELANMCHHFSPLASALSKEYLLRR